MEHSDLRAVVWTGPIPAIGDPSQIIWPWVIELRLTEGLADFGSVSCATVESWSIKVSTPPYTGSPSCQVFGHNCDLEAGRAQAFPCKKGYHVGRTQLFVTGASRGRT